MSKHRLWWSLTVVLALGVGILTGKGCSSKTIFMEVTDGGGVMPAPKNGDTLHWIQSDGTHVPVQWTGPTSPLSPCVEQQKHGEQTQDYTCTVNFLTKSEKEYHYLCTGCADPGVPGPNATGGSGSLNFFTELLQALYKVEQFFSSLVRARIGGAPGPLAARVGGTPGFLTSTLGTIYSAQAGFNSNTGASGVWYYPPSGTGGFDPINVSAKSSPADSIGWGPVGDTAWKVVVAQGTCQEGTTFPLANGHAKCTIASTAQSQYYCVVFDGKNPGNAALVVDGNPLPATPPTPTCSLP